MVLDQWLGSLFEAVSSSIKMEAIRIHRQMKRKMKLPDTETSRKVVTIYGNWVETSLD